MANNSPTDYRNGSDARLFNQATQAETNAVAKLFRSNSLARKDKGLIVNAGIAKESYLRNHGRSRGSSGKSYWDALGMDIPANAPQAPIDAEGLWVGSVSSKGMFSTSTFLNRNSDWNQLTAAEQLAQYERYGFQFHYNPTTVAMRYSGVPELDITMLTSGRDPFNPIGAVTTNSTIDFDLILNRISDMKYFDSQTKRFKAGVEPGLKWAGKVPSELEQQEIFDKGTMYDVEFLLRTVMQFPIEAFIKARNTLWDKKTADMGFLTGIPVDLHLGKSLRYLVRVENIELEHIIFNERMVPLFTKVSVTCSRIPDYKADESSSSSSPSRTQQPTQPATPDSVVGIYSDGFGVRNPNTNTDNYINRKYFQ